MMMQLGVVCCRAGVSPCFQCMLLPLSCLTSQSLDQHMPAKAVPEPQNSEVQTLNTKQNTTLNPERRVGLRALSNLSNTEPNSPSSRVAKQSSLRNLKLNSWASPSKSKTLSHQTLTAQFPLQSLSPHPKTPSPKHSIHTTRKQHSSLLR